MLRNIVTSILMAVMLATHASANISFYVFFDAGTSDELEPTQWKLSDEGKSVVSEVANEARDSRFDGVIVLAGFDQKTGGEANAMKRSQLRAEAVRDELMRQGFPSERIRTRACGYSTQWGAPQTNGAQPLHRRVSFIFVQHTTELQTAFAGACKAG